MGTASKHGSPVEERHEACGVLGVVDRSDVDDAVIAESDVDDSGDVVRDAARSVSRVSEDSAPRVVERSVGRTCVGGGVKRLRVDRDDVAVSPGVRRDEVGEASVGSPSGRLVSRGVRLVS